MGTGAESGAALLCVAVYNDNEAKVGETPAPALYQRAAAGLHIESLGFTVEERPGATSCRSVALHIQSSLLLE